MRGRPQHYGKPTMTKAQNRRAYDQWLVNCTDKALAQADPGSMGRCYGIPEPEVRADIAVQLQKRESARVAELPAPPQDRATLTELVACCEKRDERAGERLRAAQIETDDARAALVAARNRLAAWIEANPEPQIEMFGAAA